MEDPLKPRNKRERKRMNYFRAGTTGKIPWNARDIEECFRYLNKKYEQMSVAERKEWDPYVESLYFIKGKYGDAKESLYFLRMGTIINFIHYRKRLKLVSVDANGTEWWQDNLAQAFARLPF